MERAVDIVDDRLLLPEEVKSWLGRGGKLVGYLEGDTFILKRMKPAVVSQVAESGGKIPEPSLDDIAAEVHIYRQEKRRAGGV